MATFAAIHNGDIGDNKDKNNEWKTATFAAVNNGDIGYCKNKIIGIIALSKGA